MQFPQIQTKDLNGNIVNLPQDFKGKLNLILVAYERWHQKDVDSWVPLLDKLEAKIADFCYYELPVVGEMGWFGQKQLDFWMRTGIPDKDTRAKTLTLYISRHQFRQDLEITNKNHISLLLLDKEGRVIWRTLGAYTEESGHALEHHVQIRSG